MAYIDDATYESIPHKPEWYALEPFNPSLVAFRDDSGAEHRYMLSALDEVYANEIGDSYAPGTIPPEEREVSDTLLVTVAFRDRVSTFEFWWSQFVRQTESYRVSLEWFRRLQALCEQSREHRAAFCRLSKSRNVPQALQQELKRIISICDQKADANRSLNGAALASVAK